MQKGKNMTISEKSWSKYVDLLRKISDTAADQMRAAINQYGLSNRKKLISVAFALLDKYGSASGTAACEMYEAIAEAAGKYVPAAEIAELPSIGETAKVVNGSAKTNNPDSVADAIWRLVKRVSADTMLKNAIRDGAQWAWIPRGDTCAFCIALASNGWQPASNKILKGGHAEHIHNNCDCSFCIRFDGNTNVEGYDPDALYEQYMSAPGSSSKAKINAMRRESYAQNKDEINRQHREAYASRKLRESLSSGKE